MTDMTARAPKVPAKIRALFSLRARSNARKKVLSPSSENRMRRKPDTIHSLSGESPIKPAYVADGLEQELQYRTS